MKATIFDIQRNSFVDGPGVRTTVFFKGCNLRCAWCHNPESQRGTKEILFYKNKCVECGRCDGMTVDSDHFICFHDAKSICGREISLGELFREIRRDASFFASSDGGVTFSGGECMLQIDFLERILMECKLSGIQTAVDTAGHVPFEYFKRIIHYTDLFLFDVKCADSQKHKQYTGKSNELILENLEKLLHEGARVWVRIPIIPTVNDTVEEMQAIKNIFDARGKPERIELLPYHAMGEHKYAALGKDTRIFPVPSKETMEQLKNVFN